ncbi:uncharacterized protein N7506_005151 [Penicillium brevicompactum]|uniref:uncharacterized protein n=1 Tax=Penicillium brevicompactum TaxID=5074 RepID=UPI0025417B50|nr:uncharacterized protein N7506_005151 [Penicillium brevicompactum]KAJ5337129.1 hypothetical protein N7506_005151 [Penicillium brevicompactum]
MADGPRRPHDEFTFEDGRFTVHGMERIEGSTLREMFLPKLTSQGRWALKGNPRFVRSQLKHYGVDVDEEKYSGNGTNVLKSALQAGKCDQVPDYIVQLEKELHSKWLSQASPKQLLDNPDWFMQKYFLSDGKSDCSKTTSVIRINLDLYGPGHSDWFIKAANQVTGLHHQRVITGLFDTSIFVGWSKEDVEHAAKKHYREEMTAQKAEEAEEEAQMSKRTNRHVDYVSSLSKNKSNITPIGSYTVDSPEIEESWPGMMDDTMGIEIHATDTPGVFQGDFNFRVAEGVMFLCADKYTLEEYCSRPEHNRVDKYNFSDDEETDDEELQRKPNQGIKRSLKTSKSPQKTKQPKAEKGQAIHYFLQHKSRETGEGVVDFQPHDGKLKFDDERLVSFSGDTSLSILGKCSFSARKVSDVPHPSGENWSNFSEKTYDRQCIARWH